MSTETVYETVIGLEIHVQLATASKLFSGASIAFGAAPNTQACPVDLGLPGVLPVLNADAVRKAVTFGLVIGAQISPRCIFDRKNYFYPDLPKGYQISQYKNPIVGEGKLTFTLPDGKQKTITITRAHLEEDAGKSVHDLFPGQSGIDLNRAGTPLLEVVTEPELRSATEAVACLKRLHALVRYLGVSDGNMNEGSFRCDVNVSLRPVGSNEFGTRTETKNLNSFRFVERAIACEVERQEALLRAGGKVQQQTLLYDDEADETRPMRSKEFAQDYRYFPDPDLLPLVIDDDFIAEVRALLPELAEAKRARFQAEYALSDYDADYLTTDRALADYFESAAKISGDGKLAANWVMGDVAAWLNRQESSQQASNQLRNPGAMSGTSSIVFGTIEGDLSAPAQPGRCDPTRPPTHLCKLSRNRRRESPHDSACAESSKPRSNVGLCTTQYPGGRSGATTAGGSLHRFARGVGAHRPGSCTQARTRDGEHRDTGNSWRWASVSRLSNIRPSMMGHDCPGRDTCLQNPYASTVKNRPNGMRYRPRLTM